MKKAYLMGLVDVQNSRQTAAYIAMLLQPATVETAGDSTGQRLSIDEAHGLNPGGAESPTLFHTFVDTMFNGIATARAPFTTPSDPRPALAFANDSLEGRRSDLLLQLLR